MPSRQSCLGSSRQVAISPLNLLQPVCQAGSLRCRNRLEQRIFLLAPFCRAFTTVPSTRHRAWSTRVFNPSYSAPVENWDDRKTQNEDASHSAFSEEPQIDPVAATFRTCYELVMTSSMMMVSGLSDMLMAVSHPGSSRSAVENSVKGALLLLGLVLLQSVLSFVLTVGFILLALYVSTQVFGVRLPIPQLPGMRGQGQRGQGGWQGDPRSGTRSTGRQYSQPPPYTDQPYGQQNNNSTAGGQRAGQYSRYGNANPRQRIYRRDASDVIDVYYN